METTGQIALVTGGSRGIGRAIAVALAATGRHVIICFRSGKEAAEETLAQITQAGGAGEVLAFDVSDRAAAAAALEGVLDRHGALHVLVNNAGIKRDTPLGWMEPADWDDVINTNLTGFYNVTRPAIRAMLEARWGRVINIASATGQTGMAGQVNYASSKAGLIGATRALSREVAKYEITVNAVAPGLIDTEMLADLDTTALLKTVPAKRLGLPEEVAHAATFLCSPEAAYITGQVLGVNGGMV